MNNNNQNNGNGHGNNGSNNHQNNGGNNSNQSHDWKDGVRETVITAANEAVEDARDLAYEAKEEIVELARDAKAKYDSIAPAKKMEINHWASILVAVVVGLLVGLGIGWSRGHNRGMMMQNNHMSMSEMMEHMTASMEGLTGAELEQEYLKQMIVHHEGAVNMATKLVGGPGVTNDQLRAMAAEVIRAQSAEIEQMKALQK